MLKSKQVTSQGVDAGLGAVDGRLSHQARRPGVDNRRSMVAVNTEMQTKQSIDMNVSQMEDGGSVMLNYPAFHSLL